MMYNLLSKILNLLERSKLGSCMLFAENKTKELLNSGNRDFKVIEGYVYFSGDEYNTAQHTWIELSDGTIVDETLDQFEEWGVEEEDIEYLPYNRKEYLPEEYLDLCKKYPVEESSIDFPRSDLELHIWQKEDSAYLLRPEVKNQILTLLDKYPEIDLLDSAKEVRIVGSICTNLYTEDADVDVHLVPNDFSEWDEKKVKVVMDWFSDYAGKMNAHDAYIGKHPIEVYVQLAPLQDLMSDGAYDLLEDKWLKGPKVVPLDYDPYKDFSHIAGDIRQSVQDADILMGELKRDVIDYEVIKKAMEGLPAEAKQRLHLKLKNKLVELEKDIDRLYTKRKVWVDARHKASKPKTPEEALKDVELAKKWKDTNALFKFINRYQYLRTIDELEKLLKDDSKISPEEVDTIRGIVGA